MKAVNDVIAGREVLDIDHSPDGTQMRVVVRGGPSAESPPGEEVIVFEATGSIDDGGWRVKRRRFVAYPGEGMPQALLWARARWEDFG